MLSSCGAVSLGSNIGRELYITLRVSYRVQRIPEFQKVRHDKKVCDGGGLYYDDVCVLLFCRKKIPRTVLSS